MKQSLGMIEVIGYSTAITIADTMAKVANIEIVNIKRTNGGGWMTIFIEGDVAAVQAAIQAGTSSAKEFNNFVTSKVIPRPSEQLEFLGLQPRLCNMTTGDAIKENSNDLKEVEPDKKEATEPPKDVEKEFDATNNSISKEEKFVDNSSESTKRKKSKKGVKHE